MTISQYEKPNTKNYKKLSMQKKNQKFNLNYCEKIHKINQF